jgi:hypothetical protein
MRHIDRFLVAEVIIVKCWQLFSTGDDGLVPSIPRKTGGQSLAGTISMAGASPFFLAVKNNDCQTLTVE